ncbi:hypothetical protein Tco_1334783 [Tanacetum coccineum]
MEEDYEPTVQHQRRVNPKIHDVIKKEVEKLLDAGLIYPISDSLWVEDTNFGPKLGEKPFHGKGKALFLTTKSLNQELMSIESYSRRYQHSSLTQTTVKEFDVVIRKTKKEQKFWPAIIFNLIKENPHQDKLENKEITETFPLETLGSVALRVDNTP